MPEYHPHTKQLTLKLVYYGPALSGKTTNLMALHDLINTTNVGDMMVLETKNDRTLFFDLLPARLVTSSGLSIKLKLFTVPGQVAHDSTRKAVLSRADGVVFVADSQRTQGINNAESFNNLADNAGRVGIDFNHIPLVVQFNKRDLPTSEIESEAEILERWKKTSWPIVFAAALRRIGVAETLTTLLSCVYTRLDHEFRLKDSHELTETAFVHGFIANLPDA